MDADLLVGSDPPSYRPDLWLRILYPPSILAKFFPQGSEVESETVAILGGSMGVPQ